MRIAPSFLRILGVGFVSIVALALAPLPAQEKMPGDVQPPVAKKIPRRATIHDDRRTDDYGWLRDRDDPLVLAHLKAENAHTKAALKPTAAFQEALYKEYLSRIKQTDLSVPYRQGDWWYYSREEEGKQYPIYCRKRGKLEAKEEITLDLNELAKGQGYLTLQDYQVSDDGKLLAYSIDVTGGRNYTLHVKDLQSGKVLPDRIEKVNAPVWAADNQTIFYAAENDAKRPHQLFRHRLGAAKDDLLYEEKDESVRVNLYRTRDRAFLLLDLSSLTTSEVRFISSAKPMDEWRTVVPRVEDQRATVDHRDGQFWILTNRDAKNFRLVTTPVAKPQPENWKDAIGHRSDVLLQSVDIFAGHAVVTERTNGFPRFRVVDLANNQSHAIELPESICDVSASTNLEAKATTFRFNFQSYVSAPAVYEYDLVNRKRTLLKQTEVLGGYDPTRYKSELIFAKATDGTRIPVSLVYRKDVKLDGKAPMLLYGYGAYGISMPTEFATTRFSLLDRGVIYAVAHVRGGNDMGETWHDQGKLMNKRNTFTDFIAAAEHVIAQKYTSSDRLACMGESAGGLLIGAVLNMRPDLFKSAIMGAPFVDVINTMLDPSLPLTTEEYVEWGDPNKPKDYAYMKSYCPYTNIGRRAYPALFVRTGLNDTQVMYFEPTKFVAKLRSLKTDKNPLLLYINMDAGHHGASGRYDSLRETAREHAFLLQQWGIGK